MSTNSRSRLIATIGVAIVPLAFAGLVAASFASTESATDRIPAAVVNSDQLVQQTAADGTETPVFAGRQLVTELTDPDAESLDWVITNQDDAEAALAAGEVYAVVEVPEDFSASILSLQSDSPERARITVRTDEAHDYLTGPVVEAVGAGMTAAFGKDITEQYLTGVYAGLGDLGESLGTAADGAGELGTGATGLGDGLDQLAGGLTSTRTGADELAGGIEEYTSGVDAISGGLSRLSTGAGGLTQVVDGVTSYTGGVSQLSAALATASVGLSSSDPVVVQQSTAAVQGISAQLATAAAGGGQLAAGADTGITSVQSGLSQSAAGARRLAAGSDDLVTGAASLASGLGELSTAATTAASGADELATGATTLADGLREGANQVPDSTAGAAEDTAAVAADPIELVVDRENEVAGVGQIIATFFVPLGLWIGALAVFVVLGAVSRTALASSASAGRVLLSALARAAAVAVAQALLMVAMLHVALAVPWSSLPATLGFALLTALAFTAFHQLLVLALGRAGLVLSLLLLAVQLTSTGGVYPVELLATPFQAISPLLPLTYAVSGMQGILAGANGGVVAVSVLALAAFGLVSVLLSLAATRRTRRAGALRAALA